VTPRQTLGGMLAIAAIALVGIGRAAPMEPLLQDQQAPVVAAGGVTHYALPDTDGETCLMCHTDVADAEVVHLPVSLGGCTNCHTFTGEGDATTVSFAAGSRGNSAPLCTMCHGEVSEALEAEYGHWPAKSGNCLFCHDPHGSAEPFQLKSSQVDLCGTCHAVVAEDVETKSPHAPAAAACSVCHDPHGGSVPGKLREPVNQTCLACHGVRRGPAIPGQPKLSGRVIPDAWASLLTPSKQVALGPLGRTGHPIVGHPVSGPSDPANPEKPLSCVSCHSPHGAVGPGLLLYGGGLDGMALCAKCHTSPLPAAAVGSTLPSRR